jgi:catalase
MHSMTVGSRGPVLLEDYHLLEKLAQFHRCGLGQLASSSKAA